MRMPPECSRRISRAEVFPPARRKREGSALGAHARPATRELNRRASPTKWTLRCKRPARVYRLAVRTAPDRFLLKAGERAWSHHAREQAAQPAGQQRKHEALR